MKNKVSIICLVILLLFSIILIDGGQIVYADELSDNINEQMENIDFSELEDFFTGSVTLPNEFGFIEQVNKILNGQYDFNFNNVFEYIFTILGSELKKFIPAFIGLLIVAIICGVIKNINPSISSDGVNSVVVFACLICVIMFISTHLFSMFHYTENTIKNIAILTEIMSPIISALMIASGATVSASVYTPSIVFFSTGIITAILTFVLPLVGLIIIFSLINSLSNNVKLNKFIDLFSSVIKWIIGFSVTIFGIFLTIQGLTSASFDGLSIKAAKYAISNSIPLVGGFLRDGFDIVVVGSVLIKNAVGVVCVVGMFYLLLSPIISIATFSLVIKAVTAIIEPITDDRIVCFCTGVTKGISFLNVCLFMVGILFFIIVLLMILSANAFV